MNYVRRLERSGIAHFSESVRGALFFNEQGAEISDRPLAKKLDTTRRDNAVGRSISARKFEAAQKPRLRVTV
jgi:hypothetical protein